MVPVRLSPLPLIILSHTVSELSAKMVKTWLPPLARFIPKNVQNALCLLNVSNFTASRPFFANVFLDSKLDQIL